MKVATSLNLLDDVRNLHGALPHEITGSEERQRYVRILQIHNRSTNAPSRFRAWLWAAYLQHLCCRYLELYEYKVMDYDY